MGQVKIFISSTCYDLKQVRADLFDYFSDFGFTPILSENNDFPIDPQIDTVNNCIENVKENTDIFVLIIGNKYGSQIETGKSITNTEYLYAQRAGIPIYIFIYKPLINILPIWAKNKNANFSDVVDSTKIFEFIKEVRETEGNWCFDFEKAQDIKKVLKFQLSNLFKQSLDIRRNFKRNLPDFYTKLSTSAINILLNKEELFEVLFFVQTLEDELSKFDTIKNDLEYQILLKSNNRIDDIDEFIKWLNQNFTTLKHFINSSENIMNKAFPRFYGEPGIPSDLKGLYYVSNTLARIYCEMITWHNEIKSTSVDEKFEKLRDALAQFTVSAAKKIWDFPDQIRHGLEDGKKRIEAGESKPIHIKMTLTMDIGEEYTNKFHQEMNRLKRMMK